MKTIQKTFSYRLKPSSSQQVLLAQFAGAARFIYNFGLAQIKAALESGSKLPTFVTIANQLPLLKKATETMWLSEIHSQILQQALKDLEKGIKYFFVQRKKKKNVGFPRFKKKGIKDSFRYPQGFKCEDGKIYLPKIGWVAYYDSRPIEGTMKQVTIKRQGKHWYIHIICTIEKNIELVPIIPEKAIGIDLGLTHYAYLSTGQAIENPRFLKRDLKKLRKVSKSLSRKKKGSNNRKKAAQKVGKLHQTIKNKRNDFLHKLSTSLVKNHDIIAVENLTVSGMIQNRNLAQSIADAGWSQFLSMLEYKSVWTGKHFVKIGRFVPTSKTCSSCNMQQDMPLCVRRYLCNDCGLDLDRDLNASINIRAAGLTVLNACGGSGIGLPYDARIHGL